MVANPYYILSTDSDLHYLSDKPGAVLDIRYEYDLNNSTITIGAGSILKFNGGKLKNGTLTLCENEIVGEDYCFENIKFRGQYSGEFRLRWIGVCPDNTTPIRDSQTNEINPNSNYSLLQSMFIYFDTYITNFVIEGTIKVGMNGLLIQRNYSIRGENKAKLEFCAPICVNTDNFCMAFVGKNVKLSNIEIFYNYLNMTEITDPSNNTDPSSAITMLVIDTNKRSIINAGQQGEKTFAPNDFTLENVSFSQKFNTTSVKKYNATAIRITCSNVLYNDGLNFITHSLVSHCFIKNVGTGIVINNTNINRPNVVIDGVTHKYFAWANQIYFDRLYISASGVGLDVTVKDNGVNNPANAQSPFIISSYEFQALQHPALAFVIDGGKFLIENLSNYDNNYIGEVRAGRLTIDNIIAGYGDFEYGLKKYPNEEDTTKYFTYDNMGGIHVYRNYTEEKEAPLENDVFKIKSQLIAKHSTAYTGDKIMLAQDGYVASNGKKRVIIESLKNGLACSFNAYGSKAFAYYCKCADDNSALYRVQYANQNNAQQMERFKKDAYDNIQIQNTAPFFSLFMRYRPVYERNFVTCYVLPYNIQMYKVRIPRTLIIHHLYEVNIKITMPLNGESVGYATFCASVPITLKNLGAISSDVDILSCSKIIDSNTNNITLKVRGHNSQNNIITFFVTSTNVLGGSLSFSNKPGEADSNFGKVLGITDYMEYYIDGVDVDITNIGMEKGPTSSRPNSLTSSDGGFEYYDTTLKKKVLWNGTDWVNVDGSTL